MIQANIMNLCEIKPLMLINGLWNTTWILQNGLCIPNVYGMGLFSDGGIFSTKLTSVVHHILEK